MVKIDGPAVQQAMGTEHDNSGWLATQQESNDEPATASEGAAADHSVSRCDYQKRVTFNDLHELVEVVNDDSETGPSGCDAPENRRYFSALDDCKNTEVDETDDEKHGGIGMFPANECSFDSR